MAATQMNIRIDADLKRKGDSALLQEGFSPTDAVRRLWLYLAQNGSLPPELASFDSPSDANDGGARLARITSIKLRAQERLQAEFPELQLAPSRIHMSYDELRERAYREQLLEEQEGLI